MRKRAVFVFLALWFLSSCTKHDQKPSLNIVTINNHHDPNPHNSYFFFITDNEGKIIDAQPNDDQTVILKSNETIPDLVNLTVIKAHDSSTFTIVTYAGVPKGTSFNASIDNFEIFLPTRTALISVVGAPQAAFIVFSDNYWADSQYSEDQPLLWGLRSDPTNVLATGYNNLTSVYSWFNDLQDGDTVSKDFSSFVPFPYTISLEYTSSPGADLFGSLSAAYSTDHTYFGYRLSNISATVDAPIPKMGYLAGFDRYTTNIELVNTEGSVRYYKMGEVNPSIVLPALPAFTETKSSLTDYESTISADHDYKAVTWFPANLDYSISWTVYSDAGMTVPKIGILPASVGAAYPTLDTAKLTQHAARFFRTSNGTGYDEFLKNVFVQIKSEDYVQFGYPR